jgi:hypothetical protein
MAVWIEAVGCVVAPGPPGQRGQLGRAGRLCPGVVNGGVLHDKVELGAWDTVGGSRIR